MMKKFIFVLSFMLLLSGCENMLANYIRNSRHYNSIVVVSDVNQCAFKGKVSARVRPYRDRQKDAYFVGGINSLKHWKGVEDIKGNALYNIHMTEPDYPLGQADAYQCPEEVFDRFKSLQKDKDFIYSQIKFDLKVDDVEK